MIAESKTSETLFEWKTSSGIQWREIGDKDIHAKFKGDVVMGRPHGVGTMVCPDGNKYVGKFKDGRKNGQGTTIYPDGSKYIGEFKDGLPNGQGTDIFPDGSKGIGEFREGRPWNITHRDKNGNIIVKFLNGKEIKP